jgi:hypothetical protein
MSREDDFKAVMTADTALMAILTGGIFTAGQVGIDGITRDAQAAAFDGNGYLLPCALVRQRSEVADNQISDIGLVSVGQTVEIYLYQDAPSYAAIDSASARLFGLFHGHAFNDTFETQFTNLIDRSRDAGALSGASMARMDFFTRSIKGV